MLGDLHKSLTECISRAGSAWEAARKAERAQQHLAFGDALAELDDALSTIATMRSVLEGNADGHPSSDRGRDVDEAQDGAADKGTLGIWFAELVDDIAEGPFRRHGRAPTPDRRPG